jgi:hypothetical protein
VVAQKRKATSDIDQKGKKQASMVITNHILGHPKPDYAEDDKRRAVLQKNSSTIGCGLLMDLPWRYVNKKMVKIVLRKAPPFRFNQGKTGTVGQGETIPELEIESG